MHSFEGFSLGAQAAGSIGASVIDDAHWLVALEAGHLYAIVLHNILLDNSVASLFALRLLDD